MSGKIQDMTLLHTKDTHFDLIVPKGCYLVEEGGLDYQREANRETCESMDILEEEEKEEEDENASLRKKLSIMEKRLQTMIQKVNELENESKKYSCHKCELEFESKADVKEHIQNHIDTENITCNKCNSDSHKSDVIQDKIRKNIEKYEQKSPDTEHFDCQNCELSFKSQSILNEHNASHNKNKCVYCGTIFWTKQHLEEHLDEVKD